MRQRTSWVESTDDEYDSDSENDELPCEHTPRRAFTASDATAIEALQNAAEHHRRQARRCRDQFQQILRRPAASTSVLQRLLNDLKNHEKAYEVALQNLAVAKEPLQGTRGQQQLPRQGKFSQHRHYPTSPEEQCSNEFGIEGFRTFLRTKQTTHPLFAELDEFGSFFGTPVVTFHRMYTDFGGWSPLDEDRSHFSGFPRAAFGGQGPQRGFTADTCPHRQQFNRSNTYSVLSQGPPATLLKPDEAKRLFKAYNDRWTALDPTDPNIPYPARRLQSTALEARDSLWAPLVSSPISTWSEELVMQANAKAFFLSVVDLTPQYTETGGTGKISMSFDKPQASPPQAKELIDILKKEKFRWHSDRLGRRNGGIAGPNEGLQRNEKARAVFHAVCELMEVAQ